jgi:hypothetical protein
MDKKEIGHQQFETAAVSLESRLESLPDGSTAWWVRPCT